MGYIINALLRLLQFAITLLTLGLSGALPTQQSHGGSPTRINYSIFASAFALLTLLYLLPATLIPSLRAKMHHPALAALLDALNSIFFLAAAIALAAQLGVHSCGNRGYLGRNGITNGGGAGLGTQMKRCREAQALCAFFWFGTVAWAASALMEGYRYFQGEGGRVAGSGRGMGRGRSGRAMAQV